MFRSLLAKAKPAKSTHAEQLLDHAERSIRRAFQEFIQRARRYDLTELLEAGDVEGILEFLELDIERFAANWAFTFTEIGRSEAKHIELVAKARKKPTVSGVFNPGDPESARLMDQASLNLIRNFTNEQRRVISNALSDGLRRGLNTRELAELFRSVIGLSEAQELALRTFEGAQRQARIEALRDNEEFVATDTRIRRLVQRQARRMQQARAETIARTESLRIVSLAREQALRQSVRAVGQSEQLVGVEWVAVTDHRTRDRHRERNGQRRRLGEEFAPGVYKPGDGGPAEVINCRCSLLYEFFDTEEELQRWLAGGS